MKSVVCRDDLGEARYKVYHLTPSKIYYIDREDYTAYYFYNDINEYCEVLRMFFEDISEYRNRKINSILK